MIPRGVERIIYQSHDLGDCLLRYGACFVIRPNRDLRISSRLKIPLAQFDATAGKNGHPHTWLSAEVAMDGLSPAAMLAFQPRCASEVVEQLLT